MSMASSRLESLRDSIEDRVRERLVGALFPRLEAIHKKRGFSDHGCTCPYCNFKRLSSWELKWCGWKNRPHKRSAVRIKLKELE